MRRAARFVLLWVAGAAALGDRALGGRPRPVPEWVVAGEGRGTPAVDETTVFFLSRERRIVAIARESGVLRWSASTAPKGAGDGTSMGSRVLVAGDLVVAGDGDVVAFDRRTGASRWRFTLASGASPGAYLGFSSGAVVYGGSRVGRLYALDASRQTILWSRALGPDTTVFGPVEAGDLVVAAFTRFGEVTTGGVIAVDRVTGKERWRQLFPRWTTLTAARGSASEPLVAGGWVIAASQEGVIYALDHGTGHVAWAIPGLDHRAGGRMAVAQDFRPLARSGPLLVAGSLTGEVAAYELDTQRQRWLSAPVLSSVAFGMVADDELVYVPFLSGHLVAMNVRTGDEVWRLGEGTEGFAWTPFVGDRHLYVSASGAGFLAFPRGPSDAKGVEKR